MHMLMQTAMAGHNFVLKHGDLVDLAAIFPAKTDAERDAVAAAWVAGGIAIEAPGAIFAASRIADLDEALRICRADRDAAQRDLVDLKGKAQAAAADAKSARVEMDLHRKALVAAQGEISARDGLIDELRKTIAGVKADRDEFQAQAEALGADLAALQRPAAA